MRNRLFLGTAIVILWAAFFILSQPPSESKLQFVKKDSLPNSCGKGDAVEVQGKKFVCVSSFWKEMN